MFDQYIPYFVAVVYCFDAVSAISLLGLGNKTADILLEVSASFGLRTVSHRHALVHL